MKLQLFLENARLLAAEFGITPLLYGSLGLEYLTGESLNADDIDILIPNVFLTGRWPEFRGALEAQGYILTDEREHTFEKGGVLYSYAQIEELEAFAGINPAQIPEQKAEGVRFRLLTLEQYYRVYTASSRDGYRVQIRQKKDADKLTLIQNRLRGSSL